jgi:hypothetical protein
MLDAVEDTWAPIFLTTIGGLLTPDHEAPVRHVTH